MSTVQFKLSKQGALTRRLEFTGHPTWDVLSSKISALFGIPTDNVGASYVDQDGDEIVFSSEEELQAYYSTLDTKGAKDNVIKLVVQDLSSLRSTNIAPSRTHTTHPQQSHFRNTFGEHDFDFEVDDEWQRLPGNLGSLFWASNSPESPHAFVEDLESDVSVSKKFNADEESSVGDVTHSDVTFTLPPFRLDKGKSRVKMQPTVEDDVSSTDSVFGDDASPQPQVRVSDSEEASIFGVKVKSAVSVSGTATPAQAQSTPVISGQVLPEAVRNITEDSNAVDPALPTVDNSTTSDTGASSLTHDVAAFLKTLSGIISSHPELSEGVRNIVANATNGTYWAAHRDALSRAAENIQQETGRTVEEIRHAEEEAGARVADALGGIFRVFGEAVQTARTATESFQPPAEDAPTAPELVPEPPCSFRPREFFTYPGPPPPGHFPPHPHHRWGPPPPPPFGRRHGWPRPPPPFWGAPLAAERQEEVAPHVDHHGNVIRTRTSDIRTTLAEARNRRLGNLGLATPTNVPPPVPNAPAAPPAPVVPPPPVLQGGFSNCPLFTSTPPTQEELRADVERAKADYKMRKERYRHAKSIRKMAEQREQGQESSGSIEVSGQLNMNEPTTSGADTSASQGPPAVTPVLEQVPVPPSPAPAVAPAPSQPATPATPQVHIVSNARGPYPQLEMFSVPRRSHAIGHTQRRGLGHHEDRSMQRIMRKLSEVC
ncbi:uncharacterized protein EDB91DRAFT_258202 [Suillus paluster]|uniref:uncharacterized protein n=1 Tax=Suillus paluster TaxID=48578 RepID=UPI001B87E414|nr:uncharacterized protein EDB91DRAFT_258202 [Suillus paluster]KAG1754884.1 hypothetical protein EDB91DRAFT_258202 [Suillus paluster]